VPLLDDALEATFGVAHDATIAGRVVQTHAHQRADRAVPAMCAVLLDERDERFGPDERHVAGEHEQRRRFVCERIARGHDGVACAALFGLRDKDRAGCAQLFAHRRLHLSGLMTDYDVNGPAFAYERGGRVADVRDERATTELM